MTNSIALVTPPSAAPPTSVADLATATRAEPRSSDERGAEFRRELDRARGGASGGTADSAADDTATAAPDDVASTDGPSEGPTRAEGDDATTAAEAPAEDTTGTTLAEPVVVVAPTTTPTWSAPAAERPTGAATVPAGPTGPTTKSGAGAATAADVDATAQSQVETSAPAAPSPTGTHQGTPVAGQRSATPDAATAVTTETTATTATTATSSEPRGVTPDPATAAADAPATRAVPASTDDRTELSAAPSSAARGGTSAHHAADAAAAPQPEPTLDAAAQRPAPTPAPAAAPSGRAEPLPGVAEQLVRTQELADSLRASFRRGDRSTSLSIQLHPAELGAVRIEAKLVDGVTHLVLRAESGSGFERLSSALDQLRNDLDGHGVDLGGLELQHGGTDDGPHQGDPGGDIDPVASDRTAVGRGATTTTTTTTSPHRAAQRGAMSIDL